MFSRYCTRKFVGIPTTIYSLVSGMFVKSVSVSLFRNAERQAGHVICSPLTLHGRLHQLWMLFTPITINF